MDPLQPDSPLPTQPFTDIAQIDAQLSRVVNEVLDGVPATNQVSAQVLMPPADKMAIRLVPVDALERLRDSQQDTSLADGALWAIVGALVGILANIPITGQPPSEVSLVIVGALAAGVVVMILVRVRLSRRSKRIREVFYQNGDKQ